MWWNDQVKATVKRKEDAWKEVLGTGDEDAKERCSEVYKEEKRKVKRYIYQSEKEVQEQFEGKMNQDVNGNRKLFCKEVSKVNRGKVENSNRIKDVNGRLAQGEDTMRKIWRKYFEDLYNIDTQEEVTVNMCGFHRIRRGNYFGREPIGRAEVEVRVGKLKNGKAAGKDEITGEMIKGGGDRVVD